MLLVTGAPHLSINIGQEIPQNPLLPTCLVFILALILPFRGIILKPREHGLTPIVFAERGKKQLQKWGFLKMEYELALFFSPCPQKIFTAEVFPRAEKGKNSPLFLPSRREMW